MYLLGKPLTKKIIADLSKLKSDKKFVVFRVGEDASSIIYVKKKKELFSDLGVKFEELVFDKDISQSELVDSIMAKNQDETVGGIIVQMPLPAHIDKEYIALSIDPEKDVDGFHFILKDEGKFNPPTILAIDEILNFYNINLKRKKILIVGEGFLVGGPLKKFWLNKSLNVDVLDKNDPLYSEKLKSYDIIVVATGGGKKFFYNDFSSGSVVVDASTICDGGKLVGDVDTKDWRDDIDIAPVPGGVGPVTVAMLAKNFFVN